MDLNHLYIALLPLFIGWILDWLFGDPPLLPHPIVGFGKIISWGEKEWNNGEQKLQKGALFAVSLIVLTFLISLGILKILHSFHPIFSIIFSTIIVFYCLAGKTLIREVRQVFQAVDLSVEAGRIQVARIVGRDTSNLSAQQIRTAALETLSENLSDGVIAPLFWYLLLGIPGMLAYKMINTLDSMIGYKNERYKEFGCWAAHIDDWANYVPARLTAFLMILVNGKFDLFSFVKEQGKNHSSPNSGFPEAALAGILNCQFGGSNYYFGTLTHKALIGNSPKELTTSDMKIAISINRKTEIVMIIWIALSIFVVSWLK